MLQVCKILDRVKLYTIHFTCYRYVRPWAGKTINKVPCADPGIFHGGSRPDGQ